MSSSVDLVCVSTEVLKDRSSSRRRTSSSPRRDDSGNSSNSSSLEHLQQSQQRSSMTSRQQSDVIEADRPWQSVDILADGYEEQDGLHVPLHKTVCCALCRKKQERQRLLRQESSPVCSNTATACYHHPLTSSTIDVSQSTDVIACHITDYSQSTDNRTRLTESDSNRVDSVGQSLHQTKLTEQQTPSAILRRPRGHDTTRDSFRRKQRSTVHGSSPSIDGHHRKVKSAVTDPMLLEALQSTPYGKRIGQLSPQDEKLLALMAARKQQEQEQQMQREQAQVEWDNEMRRHKQQKQQQRRSAIDPSHQSQQVTTCRTYHGIHDNSCNCGRCHNRQMNENATRSERQCMRHRQDTSECRCQRCTANDALERKRNSADNMMHVIQRKAQTEKCLEDQKKEMENYIQQLKHKQDEEERRINILRQEKQAQAAERARLNDQRLRTAVENAKEQERMEQQSLDSLQETIDENLSAAEMKARRKREEEAEILRDELQRKIDKSREKQEFMENELKRWQEQIVEYHEMQGKHARALAQANIDRRRESAAKQLETKKRQQMENMQRMQDQEREWKASVEASIKSKEARSKMILQEKEAQKKQAREMALLSRQMREELRLNSSLTEFDRFV